MIDFLRFFLRLYRLAKTHPSAADLVARAAALETLRRHVESRLRKEGESFRKLSIRCKRRGKPLSPKAVEAAIRANELGLAAHVVARSLERSLTPPGDPKE